MKSLLFLFLSSLSFLPHRSPLFLLPTFLSCFSLKPKPTGHLSSFKKHHHQPQASTSLPLSALYRLQLALVTQHLSVVTPPLAAKTNPTCIHCNHFSQGQDFCFSSHARVAPTCHHFVMVCLLDLHLHTLVSLREKPGQAFLAMRFLGLSL